MCGGITTRIAIGTFRIDEKRVIRFSSKQSCFAGARVAAAQLSIDRDLRLSGPEGDEMMKYAGLLAMPAGFFLTIAAIVLFPGATERTGFVLCGLAVEAMGLAVAVRGHMQLRSENR